ncbi:ATP-binding protein [Streptomyces millisiae]|uniref:ATP-binding protein n=1 Tax=Streptomyces millisiae TaxID=3075542 RepID=A0ABU2LZ78_9ACTN|nr:ATP-binding protein [Streptomyces sp. DSM 44918]MDT0322874.1 ATP-binding protein [Streptomyces sp. DSM 44918]
MRVTERTPKDARSWSLTARVDEITIWRHVVADVLQSWRADQRAVELAAFGISELLSNVVKHVPDRRCRLRVVRLGEQVYIQLFDSSAVPPVMGEPAWDAESGRGLWLLREMCPQFGWETAPRCLGVKCVWFSCRLTSEGER